MKHITHIMLKEAAEATSAAELQKLFNQVLDFQGRKWLDQAHGEQVMKAIGLRTKKLEQLRALGLPV